MTVRVGLGIGVDEVRAVMLHRGVVAWHRAVPVGCDAQLDRAVSDLLGQVPLPSRRRAVVVAAIGPSFAQIKQLRELPPASDTRLLDAAARENAGRFFVGTASTLVTSPVWRSPTRRVWCAAYDAEIIRAVETACDRLGHQLVGAAPAATLVARLAIDGVAQWQDGSVVAEVVAPGGLPELARRHRCHGSARAPSVAVLEDIAVDGGRYADAYAAVTCAARTPLLWRPASTRRDVDKRLMRGSLVALATLAGVSALLAPGLRARAVVKTSEPPARSVVQLNSQLRTVTDEINRIERFAATRRSVTRLLSDLAAALPESTAIVSLRVDSTAGTIVTLSRRAADIVPQMREVHGVSAGAIVGTATREVVAGATLERATLKLGLVGAGR